MEHVLPGRSQKRYWIIQTDERERRRMHDDDDDDKERSGGRKEGRDDAGENWPGARAGARGRRREAAVP